MNSFLKGLFACLCSPVVVFSTAAFKMQMGSCHASIQTHFTPRSQRRTQGLAGSRDLASHCQTSCTFSLSQDRSHTSFRSLVEHTRGGWGPQDLYPRYSLGALPSLQVFPHILPSQSDCPATRINAPCAMLPTQHSPSPFYPVLLVLHYHHPGQQPYVYRLIVLIVYAVHPYQNVWFQWYVH